MMLDFIQNRLYLVKKTDCEVVEIKNEVMIEINTNLDETIEKTKRLIELLREVEQIVDSLFQNRN